LAVLVCAQSGHPDFVYSGYVKAFTNLSAQLYSVDPQAYQDIVAQLDENILKDIWDYNNRLNAYNGALGAFSGRVNDAYLKAQGQSDGVKSYGRMADLLIARYLADQE
jgi:hypothetical protein